MELDIIYLRKLFDKLIENNNVIIVFLLFRNFASTRRRSSLIAGVPGDALQGRNNSSSSSSGGNIKDEDLRSFIVATPTQLKRKSDACSFGLITNGKPIKQKATSSISKPRSRRSSIGSTDSPRLVTTPGRRSSITSRSRRNSLVVSDLEMAKRRLSLCLVKSFSASMEKPPEAKENQAVFALISPQQPMNKRELNKLKSSLLKSQLQEINESSEAINNRLNMLGNSSRKTSPLSPGHKIMGYAYYTSGSF